MAVAYTFTKEDMAVDQKLGYPRAYRKLCKDTSLSPYCHGPPFTFTPYNLHSQEASRAKELDELFPIIDPQAKPTSNSRMFVSILWKQLNHLGNAGFDPAMFRVDPYGNVLYLHADSASPLAWDIDHWFPCSRGGLTAPSNLRILQWQVCKSKHNQLEFLVPWWDMQLGISINQFVSIFAASNSDFRHRAFRLLFAEGENEELNDWQNVDSHNFPQPFMGSKEKLGLAPAAVIRARKDFGDTSSSSTLRSLDINKQPRPTTHMIATSKKFKNGGSKENVMPDMVTNPYQALVMARDSLKQREETNKMKAEIQKLDGEVDEWKLKNEEEKLTIQELELALMKRKRRAEKCRRVAEAQSSYRTMLERMIRKAMHQSVVYKEQVSLNQAATTTLMARLEAQMALCSSAEKQLAQKFKLKDDLEKQMRPDWDQARKRSRADDDDDAFAEEKEDRTLIYLPRIKNKIPTRKELRKFLEEEQKLSEEALSLIEEDSGEEESEVLPKLNLGHEIEEETRDNMEEYDFKFPVFARETEVVEEEEELRKERGKGNVEKWLQLLLEESGGADNLNLSPPKLAKEPEISSTDEIIKKLNEKFPQKELKVLKFPVSDVKKNEENGEVEARKPRSMSTPRRSISLETSKHEKKIEETLANEARKPRSISTPRRSIGCDEEAKKSFGARSSISIETDIVRKGSEAKKSCVGKEKGIARTESARFFRSTPSSPSMILNMKKGVDCMRKKPLVMDDYEDENGYYYGDENHPPSNKNFLKSSINSIKRLSRSKV